MVICGSIALTTGFFKLILRDPRPYFHDNDIILYDCETGYGNPSGHSIGAVSLYMTLWRVFTYDVKMTNFKRNCLKFMIFTLILITIFSRMALGAHSLNQIILGGFIGLMIYILFFNVIELDMKPEIEIYFIKNKYILLIFSFIVSFFIIAGIFIFNFFPDLNDNKSLYLNAIHKFCPGTSYSKTLEYEAYFLLSSSSFLLGAYLGIYYDLTYNFYNNENVWLAINDGIDENNIIDMNKTKKIRWNDTDFFTSFKRLVVIVVVNLITVSMNIFVSSKSHTNVIFIFKNFLPFGLTGFTLFSFTRKICLYYKLGNDVYINNQNEYKIEKNIQKKKNK